MFVSVPQQTFMTDVLKTWLLKIQNTVGSSVKVMPKYPELNESLQLPVMVLTRVSDETMILARNSGFFGYSTTNVGQATLERLEGYRYKSQYQLDILGRSNSEMLSLASTVNGMLMSPDGRSFGDEGFPGAWQIIPLLHFANATSAGTATDIKICYKFNDVSGTIMDAFDEQELHQYSITIPFWCDYIKSRDVDKIISTQSNIIKN